MNPFVLRKDRLTALRAKKRPTEEKKKSTAEPFATCPSCQAVTAKRSLAQLQYVCPQCGFHYKISAYYRISTLLDSGSFRELDREVVGTNPLDFVGYPEKLEALTAATGMGEAVITATGKIDGNPLVIGVLDSRFLMGSMGVAVGEKITRAIETATRQRLPIVLFSASGGARMQEGIFSLLQMAKTAAALERHRQAGGFTLSVLTHPTTGGVTASFASLGDIILAEPGALIGFAGPRVIEQTIRQQLPEGFQRAEFCLEHGMIDGIVPREELRGKISTLLSLHQREGKR